MPACLGPGRSNITPLLLQAELLFRLDGGGWDGEGSAAAADHVTPALWCGLHCSCDMRMLVVGL